ncbi:MAG: DUF1573 domain-containing protein [Planctomycetota bacterium]
MRHYCKISLVVTVALALLIQSGCQEQAKVPDKVRTNSAASIQGSSEQKARADQSAPRITFEETVYDFGEVSSSRKYTGQFKFTNTGSGVLKITDVKKCCGAVVTLDKKELAPGQSGTLKVEYGSGRRAGPVVKQLRVSSNDVTKPEVTLTIKAQIVIRVDYQPSNINLVLNKENAGCPKITITSLDKRPFSITSFQSTGETITADVDPSVEATRFVLEPKVDLDKLQNRSSGLIAISLTHPELNRVSIQFRTKQRFQLIPSGVFLINPMPQEPNINKVSVVSNYDEYFEIESTSSENGIAKVVSQQAIAGGYRLEVEITPPAPDETRMFTDVVNVRLKGGETLEIKCYGRYITK